MTDAALLEHMCKLPHARANFKQLVRELGAKGEQRADLEAALERLAARGELIELRSGHFAVTARSREFAVGRLNMHRDGYGFLISDRPAPGVTGDIFIPPESAEKAMHGDRVVVRIARIEPGGRADGEIVKVLKRAHPTVVGEFRIGRRGQYVVPHDGRIQQWIEIPEGLEIPPPGPIVDRIGVESPRVASVEELDGMVVERGAARIPGEGRGPGGPRDRNPGPSRRFRRGCGDRDPQTPPAASVSARGDGRRRRPFPTPSRRGNWRGGATSAAWTW